MRPATIVVALTLATLACAPQDESASADPSFEGGSGAMAAEDVALGPVDGHELPATDLDRVQAGDEAPDFTLASLAGAPVSLSSFQGEKNVVLVFYRGHW